jgi:arylsulfatase A-like enzyme
MRPPSFRHLPRFAAFAALAIAASAAHAAAATPARPNLVLILADDMGWSDLGCYGSEIETPHLDALARGGVRFTQFHNAARCCPTRAAVLTGLYPHQAGIGHMVSNDGLPAYQGFLNERTVTLAEALRPAGYTTLMAGKWHVGSAPGQWPLDRGFDRYWGTPTGGGVYFRETLAIRPEVFFVAGNERVEFPAGSYVTDVFTDHALDFVTEAVTRTRKPFFLYFAHIAPHWPLQAKPADIAKYANRYQIGWDAVRARRFARQREMGLLPAHATLALREPEARAWDDLPDAARRELAHRMAIYAAQIDCLDQNVGRLVARLKQLGQWENTLLLFLSDNGSSAEGGAGGFSRGQPGAEIGTGGSYASAGLEWANAANTPFRKYKTRTHQGGIATPLIAHWPAGMKTESGREGGQGTLVHAPAHIIDLMPTLLDVAGATYPDSQRGQPPLPLAGQSLKPLLLSPAPSPSVSPSRRQLAWEHEGHKALRQGDWKVVAPHRGAWELYDLARDPTETHDLAAAHPDRVRELSALWRQWADRCGVLEYADLVARRQARGKQKQRKK